MTADQTEAVRAIWRTVRPEIERLFAELWAHPELPGMEVWTAETLGTFLSGHGFSVETGAGGVPTAFVARRGAGQGPKIGILAEYDALPSLDNEAVPYRAGSGRKPGHGCGHNHISPANTGAAIAAALAAAELALKGEIVVVGCPAEEILWGKIELLNKGVFDGLDVILTSHGDYQNGALSRPCHASMTGEFIFRGESAHGGKSAARNALHTAEAAIRAFEEHRAEHFPVVQLRHVYRTAGVMPGVTPEEVRLWCGLRHPEFEALQEAYEAMRTGFAATADAQGVACEARFISGSRGYLPNDVIGRHLAGCLETIGPPRWTPGDIEWMQRLSKAAKPDEPFELHRTLGYFDTGIDYYGQDDGDVSWVVPLGRINWAYPLGVPIHHWAWTALSGHPSSSPGPLMASEALALAAIELLAEPAVIEAAKAELVQRTGGRTIPVAVPGVGAIMASDPAAFWEARW